MKTIEERARLYAMLNGDGCNGECDKCTKCHEYRIYMDITAEQKAIDDDHLREATQKVIDKACEVYETKLRELKRILNDKYGAGDIISIGGSLIDFRKAVEE